MLLTRRSLLRVGVLAPLVLPRPALARSPFGHGGGLVAGGGPPDPCGTPIPITGDGDPLFTGPGCFQLMNDVSTFSIVVSNVTLLGNGHSIGSLTVGFSTATTGIVAKDLVVNGITTVHGNLSLTQTALAATIDNISSSTPNVAQLRVYGSNVLVKNCTFIDPSGTGTSVTDDNIVLYNVNTANPTSAYVTFDNCTAHGNYDVGIEGVGNWDHVTITNCRTVPSQSVGSIGGWFGSNYPSDTSYVFQTTNCTFTGNTVQGFEFTLPGNNRFNATSDAAANGAWATGGSAGTVGNVFTGNTYV